MNQNTTQSNENLIEKKVRKHKQVAAIIGIVLLVAMYIMTLVFACCKFEGATYLFMSSLLASVLVPILIWIYIWLYGILMRKKTIATLFPNDVTAEAEKIRDAIDAGKAEEANDPRK